MTSPASGSGADQTPAKSDSPPATSDRTPGRTARPPSHSTAKPPGQNVLKTRAGYAWVSLVVAALLGILVLVFILQNLEQVSVNVFLWEWNLPKGILVLLSVIVGALFTALVGGTRIVQLRRAAKKAR
ncbi:LapA family protein [Nocardia niigatensis]|uniref:LapA family protein n=1 Tax=Nocardia niigatensis TaxID=209249 RepID=UPI0002FDA870|nr:lipopolysaccharide assembly protein LapA domain-containing protein [Nocardia niigatensis]